MSRERLITVGSSLASLVLGGVIGFYAAKRHLTAVYEGEIAREIETANYLAEERWKNRLVEMDCPVEDFEVKAADLIMQRATDALAEYAGGDVDNPPFEPTPPPKRMRGPDGKFVKNAAEQAKADLEEAKLHTDDPIVISAEEFLGNENESEQSTLTYYAGDDVLADERDQPIPEVDRIVGCDNLLMFGQRSGDPNVVYVRNNQLEHEFEITLSTGKFKVEVLGLDDDPPRRGAHNGGDGE